MKNLILLIKFMFLIIVTNPYDDIDYSKANVYQIKNTEKSIGYIESDGFKEDFDDENDEDDIDDIVDSYYKKKIKQNVYDSIYMYNSNMLFTPLNGYRNL